jgi:NTP pyrophosphatase (non-canonical NTP hydrolase)
MTEIEKHQNMVSKLVKPGADILASWTPEDAHRIHMLMGLSGEVGELVDAFKKGAIYHLPLDMVNVIEEIGDIEFYLEGLRQSLGITREECLDANMKKLAKRYERFEYSDKAAKERADKVDG